MDGMQSIWDLLQGIKPLPPDPLIPPPALPTASAGPIAAQTIPSMLGIPDAIKAWRGEMTPTEAQDFGTQQAITAPFGGLGIGKAAGMAAAGLSSFFKPAETKLFPKTIGLLHATNSPMEFGLPKLPPPEHDLGIHGAIDPSVSNFYPNTKKNFEGDLSKLGPEWLDPNFVGPHEPGFARTKPFLFDTRSALKFPADAGKWNLPDQVIGGLEEAMRSGFVAPRGLLSDMYNISKNDKTWQRDFIPMLKEKGFDSLYYPHIDDMGNIKKYNTFMGFDPAQFTPRYSPEGVQLAKERGVVNPMAFGYVNDLGNYNTKWSIPKGVLAKPSEVESLVRNPDPKFNTVPWWQQENFVDKHDFLKMPHSELQAKLPAMDKLQENPKSILDIAQVNEYHNALGEKQYAAQKDAFDLAQQYKTGKLTKDEYIAEHGKLMGLPNYASDPQENLKNMDEEINWAKNQANPLPSPGDYVGQYNPDALKPKGILDAAEAALGKVPTPPILPAYATPNEVKYHEIATNLYGDFMAGKISQADYNKAIEQATINKMRNMAASAKNKT